MVYQRDDLVAFRQASQAVKLVGPEQLKIGIGAWLKVGDQQGLARQIEGAYTAGAKGVVLFSYSNLSSLSGESTLAQSLYGPGFQKPL